MSLAPDSGTPLASVTRSSENENRLALGSSKAAVLDRLPAKAAALFCEDLPAKLSEDGGCSWLLGCLGCASAGPRSCATSQIGCR